MATRDTFTPARDNFTQDELPGWTPPPAPARIRPAPRALHFLADMAKGVAVLLIFAGLWTALALFINAANGGL